jgi:hypothetical protein
LGIGILLNKHLAEWFRDFTAAGGNKQPAGCLQRQPAGKT